MVYRNCLIFIQFHSILLFLVLEIGVSVDDNYEACQLVTTNCGRGPNISYPFYIDGLQNPRCGFPGFSLSCKDNEPILRHSADEEYIISDILYEDQSMFIKRAGLPNSICSPETYVVNYNKLLFSIVPADVNLSIFFNCTDLLDTENARYSFGCDTDKSLATFSNDSMLKNVNDTGNCENQVGIHVDVRGNKSLETPREFIEEFLEKGFHLKWNATKCDECSNSNGRCGFDYTAYKFMCFCPDRPHQRSCDGRPGRNTALKIGIGFGAGFGMLLLACASFFIYQRYRRNKSDSSSNLISRSFSRDDSLKPDPENGSIYFKTPIFSYKELDEATNHFDEKKELGDGGFGTVYHGKLRDGRVVAVKRLFENNYKRVEQFMNEIEILSLLRHQNLVSLYGCTSRHSRELLLVYEYVPNGTIADHIHGDRAKENLLTWPIRMSIAIESADALAYLHASEIIHRDVKSNNILLDNNFHVKVADFGLSRLFPTDVTHVSTAPQGTPGYVDPEYYQCYQLNDKSDVYSFGVVLIELISSKPAVDISRHRHEINLANMAINRIQQRALHELVDPNLGYETDYEIRNMMTLVAELAFRCLQQEKDMRPCMMEVLEILRGISSDTKNKIDDMDTSAAARLLKHSQPLSPDAVTDKWPSRTTTPNTSG